MRWILEPVNDDDDDDDNNIRHNGINDGNNDDSIRSMMIRSERPLYGQGIRVVEAASEDLPGEREKAIERETSGVSIRKRKRELL